VNEDYFLEGLINNIRNETISHQLFICKFLKKSRVELLDKINRLKADYGNNIEEIIELETELSKKIEDEARSALEKH
jgi:hypothetical protein